MVLSYWRMNAVVKGVSLETELGDDKEGVRGELDSNHDDVFDGLGANSEHLPGRAHR